MTIEKLSSKALKICLDKNDFEKYNIISSDITIKKIRNFLIEISDSISRILDIDIMTSKLFVEVFSKRNSCYIFVSDITDRKKTNSEAKSIICQFDDFDSLEKFCHIINSFYKNSVTNSSLFCNKNNIRLKLSLNSEYDDIACCASQYCILLSDSIINSGITDEYYRKIIPQNAVNEILSGS